MTGCAPPFARDPYAGDLFVFFGRRAHGIRGLDWQRGGFIVHYKRREAGTLRLVREAAPSGEHIVVDAGELALMLGGIDLAGARQRRRWRPEPRAPEA